jgi:hypothetical protein
VTADGGRDFAARVTRPGKDPLVLPTPDREQALRIVAAVNLDSTPAAAEVVWRPAAGWRPEEPEACAHPATHRLATGEVCLACGARVRRDGEVVLRETWDRP